MLSLHLPPRQFNISASCRCLIHSGGCWTSNRKGLWRKQSSPDVVLLFHNLLCVTKKSHWKPQSI